MFVRSTVIDTEPGRIEEGIALVRDRVIPLISEIEASLGMTMLVDRDSGRTVTNSMWGTRAGMEGSVRLTTSVRDEAALLLGGAALVEQWEVAELYRVRRAEPGFATRSTRLEFDPGDAEHVVDIYRTTSVPALALLGGFASAWLLVDPGSGKGVSHVTFVDRASMEDSRPAAAEIRRTSVDKAHARATEILETELVLAELHLPDQA
jgi:hypothetical protein